MTDAQLTVAGNVTADPVVGTTKGGDVFTSFRVAVNQGYYDRDQRVWLETGTSFYRVSAFRALAVNAFESLQKGTPVLVHGKLRVVDWNNGEKQGTDAQITASAIGPNLAFGQADFTSIRRPQLAGQDPSDDENVRQALQEHDAREAGQGEAEQSQAGQGWPEEPSQGDLSEPEGLTAESSEDEPEAVSVSA